jgi:hypothetical protein
MQTSFLCALLLSGTLAMAQAASFQNQQRTTNIVGITPGQTARLNVLYPTAPAPILQPLCSATLTIADDQGNAIKSNNFTQLIAGKSVSVDLNADTDLSGSARTEIHGLSIATSGCHFIATLELIDNATQKTILVTGSETTYPVSIDARAFTPRSSGQ